MLSPNGRIFELSILIHCYVGFFCQKSQYNLKTKGRIVSQILITTLIIYQVSQVPLNCFKFLGHPVVLVIWGLFPLLTWRDNWPINQHKLYLFEFVVFSHCQFFSPFSPSRLYLYRVAVLLAPSSIKECHMQYISFKSVQLLHLKIFYDRSYNR